MADGQNPGAIIHRAGQVVHPDPAFAAWHRAKLNAPIRQMLPGVEVRRVLLGRRHHVIAGFPGKPLGNRANAVRRAADEGDFLRLRVDQLSKSPPERIKLALHWGQFTQPLRS